MTNWAAECFPQHQRHSGAAAVMRAADQAATEHQRLKDFRRAIAEAAGFVETVEGVGPAIIDTDEAIVEHVRAHVDTALKHEADCPAFCDDCEHYELRNSCKGCGGCGRSQSSAGSYEECAHCGGDGRDHINAYVFRPDIDPDHGELRARVQELEAQLAQLKGHSSP